MLGIISPVMASTRDITDLFENFLYEKYVFMYWFYDHEIMVKKANILQIRDEVFFFFWIDITFRLHFNES